MRALLVALLLLTSACSRSPSGQSADIAALRVEVEALKRSASNPVRAAAPPELGQQMLELQLRHARLWQAGEAGNWLLTQFQVAELREAFSGVVEQNGDHAALQPQRLAAVLPAMVDPAMEQLQAAVDARDKGKFEAAYDALSSACTTCHAASSHGFLVIQRPVTPILDNLR